MYLDADSSSTIQWFDTGPCRTACLWRAVLLAGVVAVVVAALVTALVAVASQAVPAPLMSMLDGLGLSGVADLALDMIAVHIGVFLVCLPCFYQVIWRGAQPSTADAQAITNMMWSYDQITAVSRQTSMVLSVLEVKRHRDAMTVVLREKGVNQSTHRVTIWCAKLGKAKFRKLAVMAAWHAEAPT